jgi:hypothetical protein
MAETHSYGGQRSSSAESAARSARELGEEIRAASADLVREAQTQAREAVERGKERAAGSLDHLVTALHGSADQLRENEPRLADAASAAARYLQSTAERLHEQDLKGLARDASGFARRNPAVFLGGAVAIGFALSRLVKASNEGEDTPRSREMH